MIFLSINSKETRGFTLIELLVVISIIGLLSSITLASVSTARARARDAQRHAMAKQIMNALELYKSDNGGLYPVSGNSGCNTINGSWNTSMQSACWNSLGLSSYLPQMPYDPLQTVDSPGCIPDSFANVCNGPQGAGHYGFAYFSGASWGCAARQYYVLMYRLESGNTKVTGGCGSTAMSNYGIWQTGSFY